ncbi:hypothetical protein ERO13_D06G039900v2 [Gossypium hirsutum]|uniref:Uncharacterized protein n=3 Tax=Gossypium TaxID=3633 RepID=A0A5J5QXM4_GOSBA|nr:hypothetical protein ES319_D06G045300v1 [Gossypium barbadense]KAG4140799.1 hypothetical protein ERO13_D06G039900v2 [Gossypium hirsutum]TYH65355.1 hypothetical protein ES332_D06G050600v1 [Gossypium tomentosum]TYI75997.1 hypothetical protein E1A91_D06G046100v1 [Gossypium mustelinum]
MLHSTTHTSLSLSLFSCFSSMSEILANSKEENSPQEQQQRSKANNMPRANLNVLPPHPWFPVNSKDDSDIGLESDGYFEEQDSEDKKEEVEIRQLEFQVALTQELTNMMIRKLQELRLEVFLIGLENENLKKKLRQLTHNWLNP